MEVFNNFINGTVTLFSDPIGILIFFGGVVGGMLLDTPSCVKIWYSDWWEVAATYHAKIARSVA